VTTRTTRTIGPALLGLALLAVLLAGCRQPGFPGPGSGGQAAGKLAAPRPAGAVLPGDPGGYLGVYEPGGSSSYRPVEQFAAATGDRPDIVMSYANWPAAFPAPFATRAYRHHAVPLLRMQPLGASMAAIAGGRLDTYLTAYARAVRAYRHPVIISFGDEMNGTWYSWGWRHTSPVIWVAAWRHVVGLFRQRGAANVTWLWTVNVTEPGLGPIQDWWPGASYVTWVGIDGYYYVPTDNFGSVFRPTLAIIRRLTGKPVLLSAVAVGPVAGQAAKIPGLFAGIRAAHLLGLVWYDAVEHDGLYHQDWRLEDDQAGLAAFRSAARRMRA
jgi:mannan endo-1,4-beta-mannosidase